MNSWYYYAPEMPIEPTAFDVFGGVKHGSDNWSHRY